MWFAYSWLGLGFGTRVNGWMVTLEIYETWFYSFELYIGMVQLGFACVVASGVFVGLQMFVVFEYT